MAAVTLRHRMRSTTPCVGTASLDQAGTSVSLCQPQPLHPREPGASLCPPTPITDVPAARTTCGCVGLSVMGCLCWPTSAHMFLAMGGGRGCGRLHHCCPDIQALAAHSEAQSSLASWGQFLLLMKQKWMVNDHSRGLDFRGLCYPVACNPIPQAWLPGSRSDSVPVPER